MIPTKLFLAIALTVPFATAQLPSIAERALKREAAKKENEARHAAAVEKQKANEEARNKAADERKAAGADRRAAEDGSRSAATGSKGSSPSSARGAKRPVDQEQGITGPTHEKYQKQVVFATADRLVDDVKESEFTTEFNLGDPIYFRVFMDKIGPKALAPLLPDMDVKDIALSMTYGMRFTLAGKPTMDLKFTGFSSRSNNLEWTTWRGYFVKHPDAEITSDQGGELFREFLARATQKGWIVPGKNKLKVEIYPQMALRDKPVTTGEVVATGEVTMNYTPGVIKAGNPVLCGPHKAVQKDAALEGQILRYAQSSWKPTEYKPATVLLTSNAWTIYRHPVSGIITRRMIEAVVESKGAEYCKYQGYQFSQVFEGTSYASGTFTDAERTSHFMPCACMAK